MTFLGQEKTLGGSKEEVRPDLRGMSLVGGSFCFVVRPLGPLKDAEQESRGLICQLGSWPRVLSGEGISVWKDEAGRPIVGCNCFLGRRGSWLHLH